MVVTVASVGAGAQEAPQLALPSPLHGYETERIGSVTWTFPESERGRVAELIEAFDEHWAEVESDFGAVIDDKLIIRVARNPREMRAMAPIGAPPPDYATGVAYSHRGLILLTMSAPQTARSTAAPLVVPVVETSGLSEQTWRDAAVGDNARLYTATSSILP